MKERSIVHAGKHEVLLYGWFGEGNLGDELILSSMIRIVRNAMPQAKLSVMSSKPKETSQFHFNEGLDGTISTYIDHRPKSIVRACKYGIIQVCRNLFRPEIVVMATGGALSDWNEASAIPILDLIEFWAARGKMIFLFGIGAGPISHKESFERFSKPLSKVRLITVRDEYSKFELEKLGLRNVVLTRDVVFSLTCDSWGNHGNGGPVRKIGLVVAPVCRETPSVYEEYASRLARVAALLADKYEVTVIPFQRDYDLPLTNLLLSADDRIKCAGDDDTMQSTLDAVSEQDLIIGMRFHSIVVALLMRKLVIPIVYHPKCYSLTDEMGLTRYAEYVGNGGNWEESNIDVRRLLESVEKIQADCSYRRNLERLLKRKASISVEVDALIECVKER